MQKKRGRPRKDINSGLVFHMAYNTAPVSFIAQHIGVHRDTIYANCREDLKAARALQMQDQRAGTEEWLAKFLAERRLKAIERKIREKEQRRRYYLKAKAKRMNFPTYTDFTADTLSENIGSLSALQKDTKS